LAGNQAEREILVMTIKEQLIKDISALPESALHAVREFVLFEIGRENAPHPVFMAKENKDGADESADPTGTAPADKKKEGYEILKQFKGTLPADFDYKNKLMEALDEKYGSH
jgi:hypothetical protein